VAWQFPLLAGSSFGLGALHALEPGHGKTVVGAYLIGSRDRVSDAVLLGLVVTLTHSGSVVLLGVLSIVAAAMFVPETVHTILEVVSGLLVLGVGGWLLLSRTRQARGLASARDRLRGDAHVHGDKYTRTPEDCDAGPACVHGVGADQSELHSHTSWDHHSHSHLGHSHSHGRPLTSGDRPRLGQLVALGIAGGIVPCPAALAVLLAAVSYGQLTQGLSLVIIFSAGMAAVLVAVGIIMVKAAGFASRYLSESKWTNTVPPVSAALITLLGVGLTAKALLALIRS
jgi:nickel/cobalt exporter